MSRLEEKYLVHSSKQNLSFKTTQQKQTSQDIYFPVVLLIHLNISRRFSGFLNFTSKNVKDNKRLKLLEDF